MTAEDVRSMPCSASFPWIAEPTRAGWWWLAHRYKCATTVEMVFVEERDGALIYYMAGIYPPRFVKRPPGALLWWWAGPVDSPEPPCEETTQNEKSSDAMEVRE